MPLERSIRTALARLAPEARRALLAVSGGSDSVALLRALHDAPDIEVVVAHLDHRLRSDAASDADFVADTCERLGVRFVLESALVAEVASRERRNVEEVGRTLRYAFLARVAREQGCDVIVTAHTRDDQAETVLLQLLRGSAHPRGIAPRQGRIVRPLLELSKRDLRGWLDAIGQTWREDLGNRDLARDRAWLRQEVLPRLERRRPGASTRLARFGTFQRDIAAMLEVEVRRRFGEGALARGALAASPRAVQREALTLLIRRHGGDVDAHHLEALLDALPGSAVTRRDLPGGVRVRVLRDRVDVAAPDDSAGSAERSERIVNGPDDLPAGLPVALTDDGPWSLRPARPGDRIRLAGGTRTVADLLGEAQVPREERAERLVLARGSEVVWVDGIAVAEGIDEAAADPDRAWMRRALALADDAAAAGELPVGAIVVRDGELLGEGANRREAHGDPLAHAELEAMRAASMRDGDWRLSGATLYVTLEPCPMCAGAIVQSQLERVVWGAANLRDGAFGTVVDLAAGPWKRVPALRGGVLAREAGWRLRRFFANRRDSDESRPERRS